MTAALATVGVVAALAAGTCVTVDGAETTTTAPTTAAPPATSDPAPATVTTVAATTVAGATTTTTTSPGAGAPVITLVPLTPEELEVVEALYAARTLATEALIDPDAVMLDERLDALFARQGQQRDAVESNRAFLRERGLRGRVNPDQPWALTVEIVEFLEEPFRRADVTVCFVDTNILLEPGGAPDGSDLVVNDEVGAIRIVYTLVVEDGRWQLLHGQDLTELRLGETECPPAS